MAFDRAAAKASGYSDEEINAYLQANPEVEKNTPPAPAGADAPPAPSTQVPDIDRTSEMMATAGLGAGAAISGAAGLAKDLISPAATAYGAYKLNQVANAAINRMGQPIGGNPVPSGPVNPAVGTPASPIGSPTATNVPVTGAVAPESVPIQQVAQQTARTAAPAEASMMSRAGQLASQYAPAMRAGLGMAGRVAGPAGLAMGAYDAGQMARETDLGGRLAGGQGQRAQQASTNMLNRNVSGYTPNPQEAQNILASGDERTINMYGGRLKLQGLASPGPNAFNSGFAQQLNRMGR